MLTEGDVRQNWEAVNRAGREEVDPFAKIGLFELGDFDPERAATWWTATGSAGGRAAGSASFARDAAAVVSWTGSASAWAGIASRPRALATALPAVSALGSA
eukprot:7890491-Alexandrium_andersonii.AAC.1